MLFYDVIKFNVIMFTIFLFFRNHFVNIALLIFEFSFHFYSLPHFVPSFLRSSFLRSFQKLSNMHTHTEFAHARTHTMSISTCRSAFLVIIIIQRSHLYHSHNNANHFFVKLKLFFSSSSPHASFI